MKQSLGLLALALTFSLSACGGGTTPSSDSTQVAPAVEPTTDAAAPDTLEVSPSDDLSGEPMESDLGDPGAPKYETSERGLTVYKEGDAIDFIAMDGSAVTGTMTINKVRPSVKCDAGELMVEPSENGRFIGLDISIVTPKATSTTGEDFSLDTSAFSAVAENGTTINDSAGTFAASLCMEDAPKTDLGPGRKASGTLILDVPKGDIVVTYEDMFGGEGWEIEVPAK